MKIIVETTMLFLVGFFSIAIFFAVFICMHEKVKESVKSEYKNIKEKHRYPLSQSERKRIVKSKDIMKEIVRFFSWEDNIPHIECGKKYNHNDKIAYDFLLKLCKLGWDGNNCEHYIKWKPFFIRILIRLGRLDLLEEVIFSEITKEDIDIIRENLNINPSFLGGSKNSFKTMLLLEYRLKEEEEREK